jgi:hypothetical protein
VIPIELFTLHQLGCVWQYLVHLEDYAVSCELSFEPFLGSLVMLMMKISHTLMFVMIVVGVLQ